MEELAETLRKKLTDYYGTAMLNGNPMAVIQLAEVENASPQDIIKLAEQTGIKIEDQGKGVDHMSAIAEKYGERYSFI